MWDASAGEEIARADVGRRVTQPRQRASLDLADPLPAEVDELADLFGGSGLTTVEAVTQRQHAALTFVEQREHALDFGGKRRADRGVDRRLRVRVAHQVAELGVAVFADRRVERNRVGQERDELAHTPSREVGLDAEVLDRRRRAEALLEHGVRTAQPRELVLGLDRETDRARGVGDAAADGLTDPPRGVRGELEALAPVELLDGVHEAEVALLHEVEEREARRLVLLGDRHHEPEVRLDELAPGGVALADQLLELALLGARERALRRRQGLPSG